MADFLTVPQVVAMFAELKGEIAALREQLRPSKPWYTPAEFGREVGRSEWVVRKLIRSGRLAAVPAEGGKWTISEQELARFRREGPLPVRKAG